MSLPRLPLARLLLPVVLAACGAQDPAGPGPRGVGPGVPGSGAGGAMRLVITSLDNDGPGSLRQAIADAPAGARILFDPDLCAAACEIPLARSLVIERDLTVEGPAAFALTLRSTPVDLEAEFVVAATATVTLSDLSITGPDLLDARGGIRNLGDLTLLRVAISASTSGHAGALFNSGTLAIVHGEVSDNHGETSPIVNLGALTMVHTRVAANRSRDDGGGIANAGDMLLIHSTVSDNTADRHGGGIWNSGNLTLRSTTVSGNTSGSVEYGGGIFNTIDGEVTLIDSRVTGNLAQENGGGIWNAGTVTLRNTTVSQNTALDIGGGIRNISSGAVTLYDSAIPGNTAADGGGIFNGGVVTLVGSSVSGNTAGWGGGVYVFGALSPPDHARITLVDSSVSENTAGEAGGVLLFGPFGSPALLTLRGASCVNRNRVTESGADSGFLDDPASPVNILVSGDGSVDGTICPALAHGGHAPDAAVFRGSLHPGPDGWRVPADEDLLRLAETRDLRVARLRRLAEGLGAGEPSGRRAPE